MAMTKTDKRKRVRVIRAKLARFNDLQDNDLREHISSTRHTNPDYVAMNNLLFAQKELNHLVNELQEEGYGSGEAL